ncbi:hypothetical protein RMSM_03736 [Rhodopirellula maiorica SM1]|uniref:Uncharacterized protein n=1 Tax=Rhodopirellula maiorica SM1 TaxID=1265738 RepID=M5RZK7_9BACT|nr:hypothetical protein RMSM_03736 [Rhodopirellula maiorica SM1]
MCNASGHCRFQVSLAQQDDCKWYSICHFRSHEPVGPLTVPVSLCFLFPR